MNVVEGLRQLTPGDFAALGLDHLAYVNQVTVEDRVCYAVHAADGTQIAILQNRDVAFAAVIQNDLEPVSVH